MTRKIKDFALWLVWFPLRSILYRLPVRVSYALASIASRAAYYAWGSRRRIAEKELSLLFGDKLTGPEIKTITKRSFRNFLLRQAENLFLDRFRGDVLADLVSVEGIENIQAAAREGKGAIILLCHFGSFLLPLPVLGHRGYTVHQLAGKPLIDDFESMAGRIFKIREAMAERMPFDVILTSQYLGPVVKALKRNEMIVIAFDGRTASKWVEAPIFNRTALVSPGPFNLAHKTGACIVPTFVVRGRDDRHRVIFEPRMELAAVGAREESYREDCLTYTRIMEKYLSAYPCHFLQTLCTVRKEAMRGLNTPLFPD